MCSYVQIFNDKIYDLIGDEKRQSSSATTTQLSGKLYSSMDSELVLRENTERGVYIEDVAEYVVQSPKEVFDLIKLGRSRLVVCRL